MKLDDRVLDQDRPGPVFSKIGLGGGGVIGEPRRQEEPPAGGPPGRLQPQPARSGSGVLIVDDSLAAVKLLVTLFKQDALKVRVATSGALALASARREPPELILLDIGMPDMDGYEVCARLKADPQLQRIPVIFLTGRDGLIDKVKAFNLGAVDYVTKPFHLQEVEARVRTHLTLRRQERELQEHYDQLQELERVRDSLVHLVVHDMRSPLLALGGSLELMQSSSAFDPTTRAEAMAYAHRATAELMSMATQLLDISRLEAGRMPLCKQRHDLVRTLGLAVASLAALAGTRRVELQAPAAFPAVYDQEIVSRVVVNLLTNAYQFTPETGVVGVAVAGEADHVRVSISDTGCGIAAEYHQAIFEKFSQVDLRRKGVGTGLGLAFCKLALEAHGGRIGVESRPGQGSTFWFTLPRGAAES